MILTCPECSTKYMAKDGTIGPNGRSVTCARCDATWYVEGMDPDALALKDNEAVLIAAETEPEPAPNLTSEGEREGEGKAGAEVGRDAPLKVPAAVGPHVLLREKADADKLSKRKRVIKSIWAVPLLGLLGLAAFGIMNRQNIVTKAPKAATLYQALGMTVKANGLDIQNLTIERLLVDGDMVLRVTGDIVNLTSQAQNSPLVQFRLENRSGESVADWFVEPGTIPGKAREKIETDYPAPPIDGVELRYRFVPEE